MGGPPTDPPPDVMTVVVEPAYFQTVVRGLVLGESFSELHGTPGHEAAIVNQRFAERLPWRRESDRSSPRDPAANGPTDLPERSRRPCAAGVGGDHRRRSGHSTGPRRGAHGVSAVSCRGAGRGRVDRARLRRVGPVVPAVRDAVNAIDPDLALGVVRTLDELRDRSRAGPADMASQFATIGGLALVFSGVGLYSAMAYAVRRRTQEIAVRMALGAQATQVRWLFLKTGAWVIVAGVVLGVPAALVVGRLLQNTFVRTEARDVVTLIVTVALLAIVALVASIVPARRATRLEPTAALRIE